MATIPARSADAALAPPWPEPRPRRSSLLELATDGGRFLLVAILLLAVLVTAWWPAHLRRPLAGGERPLLPGDA
ncbi:MAG: hypothetical protein U1E52_01325 [Geminicoccaceae bacterium]